MSKPQSDSLDRRSSRGGERTNSRGAATRTSIVLAAERLFSERGISAVPLRDIGEAAGQRNHAAVQYHFGDREELIAAVLEFRGAESELCRAGIVAEIMADGVVPSVDDVIVAFIRPLALHVRQGNHYLAFLSLLITERGGYEGLPKAHTGESVIALRALLARLAPEVPPSVLDERWSVAQTSSVHTLARYQSALRARERLPAPIEVLVADLVVFLAAGLSAPAALGDPRAVTGAT